MTALAIVMIVVGIGFEYGFYLLLGELQNSGGMHIGIWLIALAGMFMCCAGVIMLLIRD